MAQRFAKGVGKPKSTPICPFFFHLYEGQGLLTADEELDYRTAKEMAGYRITPDPDLRPGTDEDEPIPTPTPFPRPRPSRTPNRRRKSTYRAPSGSPPVQSRGPSSPVPPEPQPRAQQLDSQPKRVQEWVEKPFVSLARSIRQARVQYESMEQALEQIGSELGVRPYEIIPTIRSLPKAREMDGLRARIAGLINDNDGLQAQVEDRNRRIEEAKGRAATAEARATATEEGWIRAKAESTKWHGISQKFFDSLGFAGDVVTKARLFDECMKKPEAVSAPNILRMLVDFSGRVENLLKKIWLVFQHGDRGHEAGPSERRPEPVPEPARPKPSSPPVSILKAPRTGGPSASTPRPEATQPQSELASTPIIPDPTHQEPIPDSLNTDDIPSLHQWGPEGLRDSVTPATRSRGPTNPVIRMTLGSVTWSQQRRTGSVQTNLFGETLDDPTAGFRRHVRQLAAELRAETGEDRRILEGEDDPVADNPVEDGAKDEDEDDDDVDEDDEDKEEEEDPGHGDSRDDDEDDDSPPASSHRPVTRSTPKKKPVSRPKRKAYRNQSGPGSSSRKWTRDMQ